MILLQEVLISEDIFDKNFVCNLDKCKGACCVEGDYGAPLEKEEVDKIQQLLPQIDPYLNSEGRKEIERVSFYTRNDIDDSYATALIDGGACVFVTYDENGTAKCAIENAHRDGAIDFLKPISCHLYPIRINDNLGTGFEAMNYDKWDICNPACVFGNKLQVTVYEFLKEPLIRKYGEDFYEELDALAKQLKE